MQSWLITVIILLIQIAGWYTALGAVFHYEINIKVIAWTDLLLFAVSCWYLLDRIGSSRVTRKTIKQQKDDY